MLRTGGAQQTRMSVLPLGPRVSGADTPVCVSCDSGTYSLYCAFGAPQTKVCATNDRAQRRATGVGARSTGRAVKLYLQAIIEMTFVLAPARCTGGNKRHSRLIHMGCSYLRQQNVRADTALSGVKIRQVSVKEPGGD